MNSEAFTHPELNETYEKLYLGNLIKYLESKNENKLVGLLKDSICCITTSTNFSKIRWDGFSAEVYFHVPVGKIGDINVEDRKKLKTYCNDVMPKSYGYDIMKVEIIPNTEADGTMSRELTRLQEQIQRSSSLDILPSELIEKGKDMANVYLYLYCVENSLRLFIEKIGQDKFGNDYLNSLSLRADTRRKITSRKEGEDKNKWLRIRGDSDIFYMDFEELGSIIQNNWEIFKDYFPSMAWIMQKIEELVVCRNLVAHNSYIGLDERELISSYYKSILKQIGSCI
jgi:hypothetical protein